MIIFQYFLVKLKFLLIFCVSTKQLHNNLIYKILTKIFYASIVYLQTLILNYHKKM